MEFERRCERKQLPADATVARPVGQFNNLLCQMIRCKTLRAHARGHHPRLSHPSCFETSVRQRAKHGLGDQSGAKPWQDADPTMVRMQFVKHRLQYES